jgi:hypothetical protein
VSGEFNRVVPAPRGYSGPRSRVQAERLEFAHYVFRALQIVIRHRVGQLFERNALIAMLLALPCAVRDGGEMTH